MDELLKDLRRLRFGCIIGGKFLGAMVYAEDFILIAPCRSAMAQMLIVCEKFGFQNNLRFSTDKNPNKSKSKCMYLVGKHIEKPIYPAPLKLYNEDLPFVTHATHLGHELNQDCTMDMDIRMKRAAFISNSVEIRNMF